MERIHEVNSTLHMVLEINPDAMQIAQSLDEERRNGNTRGFVIYYLCDVEFAAKENHCSPLHGLPILVKDLIGTSDRMETAGKYPTPYLSVCC